MMTLSKESRVAKFYRPTQLRMYLDTTAVVVKAQTSLSKQLTILGIHIYCFVPAYLLYVVFSSDIFVK